MSRSLFLTKLVRKAGSSDRARASAWYFKTGPGQYGEGDVFVGVSMPELRKMAKKHFRQVTLTEVAELLRCEIHEVRMLALLCLVYQAAQADASTLKSLTDFYLSQTARINNWDLVDVTSPKIVGQYLLVHSDSRKILRTLANSSNLWERRIAVVATFPLIKAQQFEEALQIATSLLQDQHDLMHKAVGWMLREVGKADKAVLEKFLQKHAPMMPRTMLRYALEKFNDSERHRYLGRSKSMYP